MKVILFFTFLIFIGCKSSNTVSQKSNVTETQFVPLYTPGPQALIYKTKSNYNNLVPVLLSVDKTKIISYPHPTDIMRGNEYSFPTVLKEGYLLDNRGINENVAFLKLTYEEYAGLKNVPSLKELYNLIIDKDPLTELCDCGNKSAFTDAQKQLNDLIDKNKLRTTCKKIK